MVTKWVWDIGETICINVYTIKYFEITGNILYAMTDENKAIVIYESSNLGILKDKIRTIIAGD